MKRIKYFISAVVIVLSVTGNNCLFSQTLPKLKISDNKRHIVKQDGKSFFYLADNAWELFHRAKREDVKQYLQTRAEQGFTVIHTAAIAEIDGMKTPSILGNLPLVNNDPLQPSVTPGANPDIPTQYDYWDHVDFIIKEAAQKGIYIAIAPCWGTWIQDYSFFNTVNAKVYGEFLGKRYADKSVIWILGGNKNASDERSKAIWRSIAEGIKSGSGKEWEDLLMTYHPEALSSSSDIFGNEPWLDFTMVNTGHCRQVEVYTEISKEYNKTPMMPVIDGESLYEDFPICLKPKENGYASEAHVRKNAYWSLLSGAFGFAYGNHSTWQMYSPDNFGVYNPDSYWYEVIKSPGASQMKHFKSLMESRPSISRVPDQTILVSNPTDKVAHMRAARAGDGSYLFVYSGAGLPISLKLSKIAGKKVRGWWFNPRTGEASEIGEFANVGTKVFYPSTKEDWVLILDDASKNFPRPGGSTTMAISQLE